MPETTLAEGQIAGEWVARAVRDADLGDGQLGASFGTAASSGLDGEALLAAADRHLLEAKDRLYGRAGA